MAPKATEESVCAPPSFERVLFASEIESTTTVFFNTFFMALAASSAARLPGLPSSTAPKATEESVGAPPSFEYVPFGVTTEPGNAVVSGETLGDSEPSESLWLISSSLLTKVTASSTREHFPNMNRCKEESASMGVPFSKLVTAVSKDSRSSCGNARSDVASNSRCGARSSRPVSKESSPKWLHVNGWRNCAETLCFCKKRMYGKR